MDKKIITTLAGLLLSGLAQASAPANVAVLAKADGSVLINNGKQFVSVQAGKALVTGDHLMVMQGGKAEIRYNDGCLQRLDGGSMLVVSAKSVCAGGLATVSAANALSAQAAGDTKVVDGKTWVWVAAIAGVAAGWQMQEDDGTVSP